MSAFTVQDDLGLGGWGEVWKPNGQRRTVEDLKAPLIPAWADELIGAVCDAAGMARPRVEWRPVYEWHTRRQVLPQLGLWNPDVERHEWVRVREQRSSSSGRTWPGLAHVQVDAGSDPSDAKLVLLHELAHYLMGVGHGHDRPFWTRAWELYHQYAESREELESWRRREAGYKRTSERVFDQVDGSIWTQRSYEESGR